MDFTRIETFLGWSLVINAGVLIFTSILLVILKNPMIKIHSRLMDLSSRDLSKAYFYYLAIYKIAIIVFNLTPYLALKLMR